MSKRAIARAVLSPARYNRIRGMMLCCPMTSRVKGYVFEVVVTIDPPSAVLADQIKSVDTGGRGGRFEKGWRRRRCWRRCEAR